MAKTKIPWTEYVWNPVVGCTHAGMKGCDNCYARKLHNQRHKAYTAGSRMPWQYAYPFHRIRLLDDRASSWQNRLDWPLHWRKPRKIFVDSMSDLFHPRVPVEFQMRVFNVMGTAKQHTFQVLTKRPERMRIFVTELYKTLAKMPKQYRPQMPYPNVHLLASASTQAEVDKVVPTLLQIPAAVVGLSLEPLLGGIDLTHMDVEKHSDKYCVINALTGKHTDMGRPCRPVPSLGWIIVGCESGPNRRPCKIEWVRGIRDQCREANVRLFVKQLDINGKVETDPSKFPEDLRKFREYPR